MHSPASASSVRCEGNGRLMRRRLKFAHKKEMKEKERQNTSGERETLLSPLVVWSCLRKQSAVLRNPPPIQPAVSEQGKYESISFLSTDEKSTTLILAGYSQLAKI